MQVYEVSFVSQYAETLIQRKNTTKYGKFVQKASCRAMLKLLIEISNMADSKDRKVAQLTKSTTKLLVNKRHLDVWSICS